MVSSQREYVVGDIKRPPIHPGLVFAEVPLPELRKSLTMTEIAAILGVSRQNLYKVMAGELSISPNLAARIGALVGNGARIWLAMQADFDAWAATKRLAPELKKIRANAKKARLAS